MFPNFIRHATVSGATRSADFQSAVSRVCNPLITRLAATAADIQSPLRLDRGEGQGEVSNFIQIQSIAARSRASAIQLQASGIHKRASAAYIRASSIYIEASPADAQARRIYIQASGIYIQEIAIYIQEMTAADKFIQQLTAQPALVAKFVAHEMPANFVTALQADRAAIAAEATQREAKRETGVSNTATIGSLIGQGMTAVNTLDAIMHNKYGSQPDKMAAWLTASHIERDAQRGQTPAPPTPASK